MPILEARANPKEMNTVLSLAVHWTLSFMPTSPGLPTAVPWFRTTLARCKPNVLYEELWKNTVDVGCWLKPSVLQWGTLHEKSGQDAILSFACVLPTCCFVFPELHVCQAKETSRCFKEADGRATFRFTRVLICHAPHNSLKLFRKNTDELSGVIKHYS